MDELVERITREIMGRIEACDPTVPCSDQNDGLCVSCGLCVEKRPDAVKAIMSNGASRVASTLGITSVPKGLGKMIDHTLLKPEATEEEVMRLCGEADIFDFMSVCINPVWVPLCARRLRRTDVKVCTVVGFPLGATTSATKAYETRNAINNGASEIDMVINVGELKSKNYRYVEEDIRGVVRAARPGVLVKVILETCLLTDDEKVTACEITKRAGANFVKTSTGFSTGGATVEDISLMRRTVGPGMGVKASGGVRSAADAEKMIEAGATRIGASASVKIVTGLEEKKGY
ncbi:MAG: deoxyribose-phosphate aldolase [Candidatus Tritonobacter lacicola]|nr:deoxyribose-phosphate aldolase [Candidatus Tritonobacter lacicola]